MWTGRRLRRLIQAPLAAMLLAATGCAADQPAQADDRPGRLVALPDGRNINLRCSGRGAPLVLLESGYGGDSSGWGRVQPLIAAATQVCAYDRAGYGYSDPGPLPRDGAAAARDLDQMLDAAGLHGPYIVVGHSAGGLYARLFAARRTNEIQGLVLVDPTVEALAPPGRDGLDGMRRRVRRCLAAAEASPQPPPSDPQWSGCVSSRAGERARANALRPAAWQDQLSELDSIYGRTAEEVARTRDLLADIPVYVLTASDTAAAAPKVGYDKPESVWELQHLRLTLNFHHGWQRTVLSSHLVQVDRPEVVAEAALAMVAAARAGKPPEPLPASETEASGDGAFPEGPRDP